MGAYGLALPCLSVPVLTLIHSHLHPHGEQGKCGQGQMRGIWAYAFSTPFIHSHAHLPIPMSMFIYTSPCSFTCPQACACLSTLTPVCPPFPSINHRLVLVPMHMCSHAPAFVLICIGLDSSCLLPLRS